MKKHLSLLSLIALSLLLTGCNGIVVFGKGGKTIRASDTLMSETREASGFTAIDMRAAGRLVITQGDVESLAVRGSDNVVPLVKTSVQDGVLVIEMEELVIVTDMDDFNALTFTIGVKDLAALTVSGAADVKMDGLAASRLKMSISGAGKIDFSGLSVDTLSLVLSGAGDVTLSGETSSASIMLTGVGNIDAARLKVQTADITLQGLGNATLWVMGKLTGSISGAGNIEYYGDPVTDLKATGLGVFKSLGSK
jgi:predicted small secreted protein